MIPLRDVIPARTTPFVTVVLLAVNAVAFLYEQSLAKAELERFIESFGLVPAFFDWTSVITSMFLHGGWAHFLGNMLYLWIFGDNVEDRLGHGRYLLFYVLCGVAAAAAQVMASPASTIPMVGASGAIAGVMGAYFILFPHSRILTLLPLLFYWQIVEIPALFFLGFWFVLQFISGVGSLNAAQDVGGIAFWAHAAGFVAGALLLFVLRRPERQRVEWWDA